MTSAPGLARHSRQRGAVLYIAITVMMVMVITGVAYLEVAVLQSQVDQKAEARVKCRAVAEAGIDVAYQRLYSQPTFRGALTFTLAGETHTVVIEDTATGVRILSGDSDSLTSGLVTKADIVEGTQILMVSALRVLGGISATGSGVTATELQAMNVTSSIDTQLAVSSDYGTVDNEPAILNVKAFADNAERSIDRSLKVSSGTYEQSTFINGDVALAGDITVKAPVMATGTVEIVEGHVKFVAAEPDHVVLLAQSDVTISGASTFEIYGTMVVMGNLTIQNVGRFKGEGTLIVNGELIVDSVPIFEMKLDVAKVDEAPQYVDTFYQEPTITEVWRVSDETGETPRALGM